MLDNGVALSASNKPSKFRTKNWVEINDESRGTYNTGTQIKFKTTMLKSSLRDYSDTYILLKETVTLSTLSTIVTLSSSYFINSR